MKKIKLMCILFACSFAASAQYQKTLSESNNPMSPVDIGIGVGLDYGGIGINVTSLPDPHFAIFGGVGYAISGVGYNVGGKVRFNPQNRFCVTAGGMYGYNTALKVTDSNGNSLYKKTFYGPSFSVGGDLRKRNTQNYWSFQLIIPVRSSDVSDEIAQLKSAGASISDPSPVLISVGFHFGL